jgi:hypothetical protein
MKSSYETSKDVLEANGLKGREAFLGEMGLSKENMCQTFVDGIEGVFSNWQPRKQYELFKIN